MKALIFLSLGALVFVFVFLQASQLLPSAPEAARFGIVASLAAMGLYIFSRKHRRQAKAERGVVDEARAGALVKTITAKGQPLAIKGSSRLGWALFTLGLGVAVIVFAIVQAQSVAAGLLGGVLTLFGVLCVNDALFALGKPVVVFSVNGVTTPWSGDIEWEQIYGMVLNEREHRNVVIARELVLRIKGDSTPKGLSPRLRLIRWTRWHSRGQLRISLNRTSETPQVVSRIAETLWELSTRRRNSWAILMPDHVHDAILRSEVRKKRCLMMLRWKIWWRLSRRYWQIPMKSRPGIGAICGSSAFVSWF